MNESERRQVGRASLDFLEDLRADGIPDEQRVALRNISAGGLMAHGVSQVHRGQRVWIHLPRQAWIEGTIAWVQDDRCGIAFKGDMDPQHLQALIAADSDARHLSRP